MILLILSIKNGRITVGLGGELNDKTGQKEQLKSNYIEYNLSLAQDVSELTPAVNSVQLNLGDFSYAA